MPIKPKTKSDAQAYLERRGWEPNPHNNLWRRVERKTVVEKSKDEKGNGVETEKVVEKVLEEKIEQEALDTQQGRDIEALLADNAKLVARVAAIEDVLSEPAPAAPSPAPAKPPASPAPAPAAKAAK